MYGIYFFPCALLSVCRLQRNPRLGSFTESDMNDQQGINENLLVFFFQERVFFAFVALIINHFRYITVYR